MLVFSFIVDSINKALVCGDGFGSRGCIAMSAFFFLVYMVPRRRRSWSMLWSTTSDARRGNESRFLEIKTWWTSLATVLYSQLGASRRPLA
jgi:hypothetical protein